MTRTLSPRSFGPVTRTDIVKFAGASGDFHPLHHDEEFCRAAGYPSVFAMGMYSEGLIGTWIGECFPTARIERFRARFEQQVCPGDELTVEGDLDEGTRVVEAACRRNDGTVLTRAWITLGPAEEAKKRS